MKIPEVPPISGAAFPVVFFNGRNEIPAGNIFLHPSLNYTQFKMFITRLIGISPRHISTFLVRRKKNNSLQPDIPSKIVIDESSDFAAISFERDCFVLAAMKPPQRPRTQLRAVRSRIPAAESGRRTTVTVPPVMSILRRSPDRSFPDVRDYAGLERRSYLTAGEPSTTEVAPATASRELCKHCLAAEEDGREPEFHPCVYDEVFLGYNTMARPIERPCNMDISETVGLELVGLDLA